MDNDNENKNTDEENNTDEQNKINNEEIIENNKIYKVKVIHSSATEYCYTEENTDIKKNDNVIIPTKYGKDLGKILGVVTNLLEIGSSEIVKIEKIAEESDLNPRVKP